MPIIETIAPGTIIDVEKLSQIITAINDFSKDFGSQKNSTISTTKQAADTKIATPNLSFSAGKVMVTSDSNVKTKDVIPFSFEFGRTFAHPPTVTATPQSSATGLKSAVTSNISVIVNNITTTKVEGSVYFNSEAKKTNIYIHVIAIGIPIGT
jgi:hypothetical protein